MYATSFLGLVDLLAIVPSYLSIFYAGAVLQHWRFVSYQRGILHSSRILADVYKALKKQDSAIKYLELSVLLNNTMFNQEKERDFQNMAFNEQLRQDEISRELEKNRFMLTFYGLVAVMVVILTIALMLWRNNRHKQKAKEKKLNMPTPNSHPHKSN